MVRSKSGRPLNPFTREPSDSCLVYGLVDLGNRLAAAERDRDIEVRVRRLPVRKRRRSSR
jgi:hypothetical protein